ncbi:MAG: fasciclin domain-containing protein [Caulobacteraceae bacterium]|nr:fasciclin domain-containing protein [Caulobacteraceae bacterium]
MTRILASLAAVVVLAGPAAAFAQAATPAAPAAIPQIAPAGDIVATLTAAGNYTILLKALDASNLTAVLKSAGPLTVLAPTDQAFNALPPGQLDNLLKIENAGQLQQLLVYHLINAAVDPAKIQGAIGPIAAVGGGNVQIDGTANPMTINDAHVVGEAHVTNGYIYGIDKVLTPGWTPPAAPAAAPAAPAAPASH